jgi:hypothetical protein
MRKSEAKLQESEGRNGIGEDDYKTAAFPALPRSHFQENKSTQKFPSRIQSGASGKL